MKIKNHEMTKRDWLLAAFILLSAAVVGYMYFCPQEWFIVFFVGMIVLYILTLKFINSEYHYTSKYGDVTLKALMLLTFEISLGLSTTLRFYSLGITEILIFIIIVGILNGNVALIIHRNQKKYTKNLHLQNK